jgi:hypothetical protein
LKIIKGRTHSLLKLLGKNNKEFLYLKLITLKVSTFVQ